MVYEDPEGGPDEEGGKRVQIGGADDCAHDSLRRVGSDGGYNIYFECQDCSAGIVKYSETDEGAAGDVEENLPQETPTNDRRTHPLIEGLTPDSNNRTGDSKGVVEKVESSLRDLFGGNRRK